MNNLLQLRDLKVFCLITLFYAFFFGAIWAFRAWRNGGLKFSAMFANKNFVCLYSAVYLFTTIYAVKSVAVRIVLVFIYVAVIAKMVKNDLDSRKK